MFNFVLSILLIQHNPAIIWSRIYFCNSRHFYRPQAKFAKVMFLQVSVCPQWGGGMHGCSGGWHAWLLWGGMHGFFWGGKRGIFWGRGHAWFLLGGHEWFFPGGACMFFSGGACVGYDEIRSMSGWYASYWNAFLYETSENLVAAFELILHKVSRSVEIFGSWRRG